MGLFRKKGRSDIDAWAKVMIQGYKKGMPIDKALLEQATDQSIRNDCRIIRESTQIVMRSSDYEVREKRKKLIEERYKHLKTAYGHFPRPAGPHFPDSLGHIKRTAQ